MSARAIGVDLGGTKALACLVDDDGGILARAMRLTGRATDPRRALELVRALVAEVTPAAGAPPVGVGVGFPGLVDARAGVARSSVILDGWRDVPLAAEVRAATGLACVVDNDVNAAAVAELRARAGDEALAGPDAAMLFVAVGTGIGGALVFGARPWRGAGGVAGEIGHTTIDRHGLVCECGRRGCLNTVASGGGVERALGLAPGTLAARVAASDPRAVAALREAARALGVGLANALNLLSPHLVVLGGGLAGGGVQYLAEVARAARAEAFPEASAGCRFELALAGYEAGAVGAGLVALDMARG